MTGTVYTETTVYASPAYQLVIVDLPGGKRLTARIEGESVAIDDAVSLVETREGVSYFQKVK